MEKGNQAKPHIGIFGRTNVGKSSLINALTGQDVAIVSDVAGTTTDSVKKSMEIKGVGAVVLIDTAGIDDASTLGKKRIEKAIQTIETIDMAVLVIADNAFGDDERMLINNFKHYKVPFVIVHNKSDKVDLNEDLKQRLEKEYSVGVMGFCSFDSGKDVRDLTLLIRKTMPQTAYMHNGFLGSIIKPRSVVLLVTPIDSSAPEGRMILPQVQMIRDVLDNDSVAIVVKETELGYTLNNVCPEPALVITDSQAFSKVSQIVPKEIALTSFSILLAKSRGNFEAYLKGTPCLDRLKDGDRILMLESCSHQPSCEDIGRVKLPKWIRDYTGKNLYFDVFAGLTQIEEEIQEYAMVIQCGGCMITQKQIASRLLAALEYGIPVSNYGLVIAYIHGIFNRATEIFRK
ncbi:MAG: [FeFe] hydrogenase H-cluster maturation GTPase HydF [Bacteroidales bacterium]|jgi:[FeFe] hydrogenase H-cluster maturation GTPase HydF|nr:[FeFe] hydrogenase H-cluster maturation GTPase HydF [Bacteroidales bacterium]